MPTPDGTPLVLLVDDEILARHALAEYLRTCGYDVLEAADTGEAKEALSHPDVKIAAVLCRFEPPESANGFQLASWLRQHHPGLPLLLSGTLERAAQAAADLCDEGPTLARPYEPDAVVAAIKQRLAARDRNS